MAFKDLSLMSVRKKNIVLFYPHISKTALKSLKKTLSTRWIGQGPMVDKFEKKLSKDFANNLPVISTGSGTDALHLSYLLANIKKDDEVVFYVAGKKNKSQNFIAFSHIKSVETPNELLIDPDKNKYVLEKYLLFENITLLKTPIHIKAIINQLEFIKNKTNFGVYLMGGVSKITENDFNLIKK